MNNSIQTILNGEWQMKKYNVNFINQNADFFVEEGTTVAQACSMAGFPQDLVCGGRGSCGKCRVTVGYNNEKHSVLSCQTKIDRDINVYMDEDKPGTGAKILESAEETDYIVNPSVKKVFISLDHIKNEDSNQYLHGCGIDVLRKFSELIYQKDCKGITFIYYENEIIDVQLNDTTDLLFGASVDIGTTSVVVYIYDLNRGVLLKTYSDLNRQMSLGGDVISRISHAGSTEGLRELNEKIIDTLNNMLEMADNDIADLKDNLYNIVLCGNSTMQHLLFKLMPVGLGSSPFKSITGDFIECYGIDTEIYCPLKCKIIFLPLLGGFVGADTLAVLLTVEDSSKVRLIIDLGTNGEIAAGNISKYYVASTACGPALEGGNMECGMRGTAGAIEKFKIEYDEIVFKTIGDVEPIGICGSGIIDVTAELLKEEILDTTGRMASREEFVLRRPESVLCDRLLQINGINSFVIYSRDNKQIYISQKDIRQVQLAKGSIYSGCEALLEAYGADVNDIDEVIISGAFGNYIDVNNAGKIGLYPLPSNAGSDIRTVGNGAGRGVSMYLLNRDMKNKCREIVRNTFHHELANDEMFAVKYIENMNFKKRHNKY